MSLKMFRRKTQEAPKKPQQPRIASKRDWPTGLFVSTEKGTYYVKGGSRFKIVSERALESWHVSPILANFASVKHLIFGGYLGFRDGTLIRDISNGRTYLIAGNKKHHITSPDALTAFGLADHPVFEVSDREANTHADGVVLSAS